MQNGLFGLDREVYIANSKVREVFTPYSPIGVVEQFYGRENEISQMVSVINSPGQHVLLYGDRGVGKTSLATIACMLMKKTKLIQGKCFNKRCDSQDTFATIMELPLRYAGIDLETIEQTASHTEGGGAKVRAFVASGSIQSNRTKSSKKQMITHADSPSWVAEHINGLKGLFIIDEADALSRKGDRKKLAEFIKLLSDNGSNLKVMIVGIGDTGEDLIAGHPSVERCLKETHLSRIGNDGLRDIINSGMKVLKLEPVDTVVDTITDISAGYPHFTHLICLKCAENAIVNKKKTITMECLEAALIDAVKDSEGAFKRRFHATTRGLKKEAEYRSILHAAAHCPIPEFNLNELRAKLSDRFKIDIPAKVVSRYMSNMVVDKHKGVFNRVGKGVYRFSDPRIPSYIKMVEMQHKETTNA